MAYRSYPSPDDSQSPSSSANVSPETHTTPLDPLQSEEEFSGHSGRSTPARSVPRSQNAGKGGCWTCRVRRKKCDEQREGDSCKTCRRLTIKCLGWGVKRPDWMRDKKNVDAYKASIKAQLSRAGLIRGQPRHNPMQTPSQRSHPRHSTSSNTSTTSSTTRARTSEPTPPPQPPVTLSHTDFPGFSNFPDIPFSQNDTSLMGSVSGGSSSAFDQIAPGSYNDVNLNPFDQTNMVYPYSPASMSSGSSNYMVDPLLDPNFTLFPTTHDMGYADQTSMGGYGSLGHSPSAMYDDLVMHYFSSVSKIQFIFAGSQVSTITYNTVFQENRGAPAYAIYALADLHQTQMRISQGLEAPQSSQASTANYLYQEALFKLKSNRDNGNGWSESDAIAALHLVSYSHLSGGNADWQEPFEILCSWLLQSNLSVAGQSTKAAYQAMSAPSQVLVRMIMWLDVFSSMSLNRVPKFFGLWKLLLEPQHGDPSQFLDMASLTGCSEDTLLAIAEISQLANWKAMQLRNGTLSYPELVRRGKSIEDNIKRHQAVHADRTKNYGPVDKLVEGETPTEAHRAACIATMRESALLYLNTILSNCNPDLPGVPEIAASVDEIVRQLANLPPSNLDRALVFPICLAGCMTNDSSKRDYLKGRLQGLNETYGNLLQTRLLMETLWQRRDVGGGTPDLREIIQEQSISLLLV
ncbi:hypothetical protein FA15DRAFT_132708 [Coprinopsis marcescibilis]|uniref:Zn(2)-C6 fungal-type domain-containing protein n=1 Tax=Coprinopsis marcescibilis TaxID=230819 RepID=A0A5C3L5A0_COPMA|nr:hypothetical protein FA15DRAFT_132708 [Coprinopsis marcescibilis]